MLHTSTSSARLFVVLVACVLQGWCPQFANAASSTTSGPDVEPVRLVAADRVELRGDYYAPYKGKDRAPAVLLIHNSGADRTGFQTYAEKLQRKGLGVLAIDLRGHGQSVTEENAWEGLDEAKRNAQWTYALRDVEAAAQWLSERRELHASNLTLVGHGAGAALALRQASRDERVRAAVLIEPKVEAHGFDLSEELYEIAGLPVQIAAPRSEADTWKDLHEELEGEGWMELNFVRADAGSVLKDKRLPKNLTEWIETQVVTPERGSQARATAGRGGR